MKTEELFLTKKLVMSVEVFPPKKSGTLEGVIRALRDIKECNPDFVSITYGASGNGGQSTSDVASISTDAFGLNTVAHLSAIDMTYERLENELQLLKRKGIENILTLRGDKSEDSKFFDFSFASDLACYISKNYPEFNLIGACYPEGHFEAKSIDSDIDNLKKKIDSGVGHLITQLFFDNGAFYRFIDKCRAKGIAVPIQAGIMPVVNASQISRIVSMCGVELPAKFSKIMAKYEGDALIEAGTAYATEQIIDLISNGVEGIHLYSMNRGQLAKKIFLSVGTIRNSLNG